MVVVSNGNGKQLVRLTSQFLQFTSSSLLLFFLQPIWCAIANSGESGTKAFLAELGVPADHAAPASDNEEVVAPSHRDYIISIVFIICGVVAAVLGVASNIYVQANNIFFSPH